MENKIIVNQIIPFSNVDGLGNRCAIFLQGCNVSCVYCHNPETINHCIHCGICVPGCPTKALTIENKVVKYNKSLCIQCEQCIRVCPYNASPKVAIYAVDELVEIVKAYKPFIRGVTVSGGEATRQAKVLIPFFKEIKQLGLTCYVDTNGFFDPSNKIDLIEVTDKFMIDVKTIGDSKTLCAKESLSAIPTLQFLLPLGKVEEVRTVCVHHYMDIKETVTEVSKILKEYDDVVYKLIKVHAQGLKPKQKEAIKDYIPTDDEMNELVELSQSMGVKKVVLGGSTI